MGWQVVYQPILFAGNTIINDTGIFTYSSTPAFGNLIYSETQTSGTDTFGNAFLAGSVNYVGPGVGGVYLALQEFAGQLAWYSATGAGGPYTSFATISALLVSGVTAELTLAAAQLINLQTADVHFLDTATSTATDFTVNATDGSLQLTNSVDTNVYKAGHTTLTMAANQPITSTTPVVITNMAIPVVVGPIYHVTVMSVVSPDQAAGGATYGWDGSAVTANANGYGSWKQNAAADNTVIWDGNLAALAASHAFAAGIEQVFQAEFWGNFSTGGTLNLRAQESVAADPFHIKSCIMRVEIL